METIPKKLSKSEVPFRIFGCAKLAIMVIDTLSLTNRVLVVLYVSKISISISRFHDIIGLLFVDCMTKSGPKSKPNKDCQNALEVTLGSSKVVHYLLLYLGYTLTN